MNYIKITVLLFVSIIFTYGQDGNLQLGKSSTLPSGAVYDLSDPTGVNMEVNLWGFVRFPGRYKVPITTTFMDLMSYAGGPLENSNLEEIRVVSGATDTAIKNKKIVVLNYNDVMWEDRVKIDSKRNPVLQPNDLVIVMEERRYSLRENLIYILPIITSVISIITFIITLKK